MSLQRLLLASGAALALIAPDTVAAQQFGYFDQRNDRQRYDRRVSQQNLTRPASNASTQAQPSRKPAVAAATPTRPALKAAPTQDNTTKPEVAAAPARPVTPAPLTEEQIAAKAAVDELLSREPTLWAAKERPDPALARAAAEKHRQRDLQLAALKVREEAEEARRREQAEKTRARDEKTAATKTKQNPQANKQQPQAKPTKERTDAVKSNPPPRTVAAAAVAPEPARRMPIPELPSRQ